MSSCSRAPQFRDRRGDVAGGAALKGVFQVEVSRAADQRRVVADGSEASYQRFGGQPRKTHTWQHEEATAWRWLSVRCPRDGSRVSLTGFCHEDVHTCYKAVGAMQV